MLVLELIGLCTVLFIACLLTTGTDEKNLKHYTSYPNEVQTRIQELNFIEVRINNRIPLLFGWATLSFLPFVRGVLLFACIALLDGYLLSLWCG